jgi:hypothetical protein
MSSTLIPAFGASDGADGISSRDRKKRATSQEGFLHNDADPILAKDSRTQH